MDFRKDIKGIIFDIDGVLIDSMSIWTDLGARYVVKNGKEPEDGLGEVLFSMSMEQGAEYLGEHYFPEKTSGEISEGLENMLRDFYFYEVELKPGVKDFLAGLKESAVVMTAATSSPREHVERALERNGILEFIERIYTSAEVGSSKHSPEIYDVAAGYMGLEKREICVFEDSLYALKTAKGAGYHTVGVFDENGEPDQQGLKDTAEIYIKSFEEI